MKKVTLTLAQGQEYSHTIAVNLADANLKVGQLLGHLVFKFFRSTMVMRQCGNKGFSFNNSFSFSIAVDGQVIANTITLDETLQAKVRMSNTIDGQKRFARLMMGMLYTAFGDDFQTSTFDDYENTTYVSEDHAKCIRLFADTQLTDII